MKSLDLVSECFLTNMQPSYSKYLNGVLVHFNFSFVTLAMLSFESFKGARNVI